MCLVALTCNYCLWYCFERVLFKLGKILGFQFTYTLILAKLDIYICISTSWLVVFSYSK